MLINPKVMTLTIRPALVLVAAIVTILDLITDEVPGDALPVTTLEGVRVTTCAAG